MTSGPQRSSCRPAFSLVELLIVLAIIATMAAIAAPRYSRSLNEYRADGTARRLLADLAYARTMAMTENRRVKVKFDLGQHTYRFDHEPDPDHPDRDYTVDLASEPYHAELVTVDFAGSAQVIFNAYGAAVDGKGNPLESNGTIVVASAGAQRTLEVDQPTGKATQQ